MIVTRFEFKAVILGGMVPLACVVTAKCLGSFRPTTTRVAESLASRP